MHKYDIGVLGQKWGDTEKKQWLERQSIKRSYYEEVVTKLQKISFKYKVENYGQLDYRDGNYRLYAFKTLAWDDAKPTVLITGGVHGYETSGVHGAIRFLEIKALEYADRFNFVVLPCLSPWGYETVNRWNPFAMDPNRSFYEKSPAAESALAMQYVKSIGVDLLCHIDLHETTDTDDTEFRPALAARDGVVFENWGIPDGFYLVADKLNNQPKFQKAVIDSVRKVTHIAPADDKREIIGEKVEQDGVISYLSTELGLCMGFSNAKFKTTTEVYPDSSKVTSEECILSQVAAITGALDYLNV